LQIAIIAILQTIALPTELPRRDLHFTRKSLAGRAQNGATSRTMVSCWSARSRQSYLCSVIARAALLTTNAVRLAAAHKAWGEVGLPRRSL